MYSVLCALRLSQPLDTHVSTCLMPSQLLELPHQQWQLDSRKEDAGNKRKEEIVEKLEEIIFKGIRRTQSVVWVERR